MISLYFRAGIGLVTPTGEIAPGVPEKERNIILKRHRTRCHPSHDYGNTVQAFVGGIPVGCEFDPNS